MLEWLLRSLWQQSWNVLRYEIMSNSMPLHRREQNKIDIRDAIAFASSLQTQFTKSLKCNGRILLPHHSLTQPEP